MEKEQIEAIYTELHTIMERICAIQRDVREGLDDLHSGIIHAKSDSAVSAISSLSAWIASSHKV